MQAGYQKLKDVLEDSRVETWFDMGLLLDRIKDNRGHIAIDRDFDSFEKKVGEGIAFVTFDYGIDGVSIEITKYCNALERSFKEKYGKLPNLFWIGGHFFKETKIIMSSNWQKVELPSIWGFGEWDGYYEYFHTTLARGSKEYNVLASKLWNKTKEICLELGKIIHDNNIKLLIPVNVTSNPGNVSLAFALTLISEHMDVYVLGNHHDFYWEGGKRPKDRAEDEQHGIRDHFFRNSHIGEVFSLIEVLYPWNSKKWFHNIINQYQKDTLISKFGFNPMNIRRIPTSINLDLYRPHNIDEKKDIFSRLHLVFSHGEQALRTFDVHKMPDDCAAEGLKGVPFFFGNEEGITVDLKSGNLLFLQPTRIIRRKRIELNFTLIELLLTRASFAEYFKENENLTLTLMITGPIANGNGPYFSFLVSRYREFLGRLPQEFKNRVFFCCAFGLENKPVLNERGLKDLTIHEVYAVSSLTLLPSETEGRGLPIVESCAVGVPIVCNRYTPEYVYIDVIGENLEKSKRLTVFDFKNKEFGDDLLEKISELFIDPNSFAEISSHNREVVKKRYSLETLIHAIDRSLYGLWNGIYSESTIEENLKNAFNIFKEQTSYQGVFFKLVLGKNRKYLPGHTIIEFMVYLKSLIDPSFFRTEEMELRSRIMEFGQFLIDFYFKDKVLEKKYVSSFFQHLDFLFEYYQGEDLLAIDHSLSYRHRHRRHYPYRKLTEQELMGIVGIIFRQVMPKPLVPDFDAYPMWQFKDLESSIRQYVGATRGKIVIDDTERLLKDLRSQKEIAYFPGHFFKNESQVFVVNVLKERLGLTINCELTENDLTADKIKGIGKVYFFIRELPMSVICYDDYIDWLETGSFNELKMLYKAGLFQVVKTKILSVGVHLGQIGSEALSTLIAIKERSGIAITTGQNSYMLDMIDMHSYRLGRVRNPLESNFMGLQSEDRFIQWVPAGLKPSLAYPTPIQTPKKFTQVLQSELYQKCVNKLGEEKVLALLREDADKFGNPIEEVLEKMLDKGSAQDGAIISTTINGIYPDGLPWSGAYVKVKMKEGPFKFATAFSGKTGQTVLSLIEHYQEQSGEQVSFAWNGGYILNPELVGKLGLPEDYIGSPLGYICTDGKVVSLPLYNKAAFLIDNNGNIKLQRVNIENGLKIINQTGEELTLDPQSRNLDKADGPIYYDLFYKGEQIPAKGRTIFRFMGNKVIEKIESQQDYVKVIPVGLVLSLPSNKSFLEINEGDVLNFEINGLENVKDAIEAGPLLVRNGKEAIDMVVEGWKTENSIATQAARLDFTDMRGPKIGAGVTKDGDLVLIAINGRIRESVGATHVDLANIFVEYDCYNAMGFDPGGSVTLVIRGKQLNISPYNKDYESNIYSLPPQARTVGNAILGVKL